MEESSRSNLLLKIQTIVLQDLNVTTKYQLDIVGQKRFEKQCNRLLEACRICPKSEQYIHERYIGIVEEEEEESLEKSYNVY